MRIILLPALLYNIEALSDLFNDSIAYELHWSEEVLPQDTKADSARGQVEMTTAKNERYICTLPNLEDSESEHRRQYTGPSPYKLLRPLYEAKQKCTYRLEPYWTYELCHGKFLRQYHEETNAMRKKSLQEFYLGSFVESVVEELEKNFDAANPPTRRIDDRLVPYLPVQYVQGTQCDITGQPRTTTVLYICDQDGKSQMEQITEVKSCEYEVIVPTQLLCAHPSFPINEQKTYPISCQPIGQSPARPLALQAVEKEAEEDEEKQYALLKEVIEQGQTILRHASKLEESAARHQKQTAHQQAPAAPARLDESLLQSVLKGDTCLYGGQGWWQHEYCHMRLVTQFHDSQDGKTPRVTITLGIWNEEKHREWLTANPHKAPVRSIKDNKVTQVSYLYSNGDFCDEINKPRQVEVRLRCREDSRGSPNSLTIYLLEPKTCDYMLTVEGAMFCGVMQRVNEFGIFPS